MTRPRDLDPLDPVLLARFLSGESTPAESALVRAWAADPRHRSELDTLRRAWSSSFPLERAIDVDTAWHKVSRAMSDAAPDTSSVTDAHPILRLEPHRTGPRGTPRHSRVLGPTLERSARLGRATRLAGFAAAAAVLIVTGATVRRGMWPLEPIGSHDVATTRTTRDFVASTGQRALIDLADGTHIVLAPATRLHVSLPTGARGVREMTLDGEAMFTVTHDPARPFVVHSRYGTTVDIGTSFAVRAYAGEPYRVTVRDGRVALGGSGSPVLIAGDVALRDATGAMHVTHGHDAAGLLDWSNGRLMFEHTRFADLVPDLERWYGVTIRIATPALRDRIVTGQFDTESRTEAMDALGRTLGAQHTTDGAHVTFSLGRGTR